ncbi:MAG TPA: SET domain-containing protein-lysine N-methyltransferase [Lapillicoccus sp.]|nr:SET domain-containing protein-lysine N-methyltransferase [Lapillicoccus sp.]
MRVPPASCWLHPSVEVRPSAIAGRGLFATADLPARTIVSRLGGRLVSTAELARVMAGADPYVDTIVVGADRHLLVSPGETRFGNHSCDPNLGWVDEYTLATMVDVPAGQELVSDYAMSTADPDYVLRCHCPSYRCRQMVEGSDWRIPQLQARYQGWWVPYVQSLVDAVSATPSATAGPPAAPGRPPGSHRGP